MLADIPTANFPAQDTIEERAGAQSTCMNTVYRAMHKNRDAPALCAVRTARIKFTSAGERYGSLTPTSCLDFTCTVSRRRAESVPRY